MTTRCLNQQKIPRRLPIVLGALVLVGSFVGCSSSSSSAKSVSPGGTTVGKLDKTATCDKLDETQNRFATALTSLTKDGKTSAVRMVTQLDPIRADFAKLAKTTNDSTLAGLLSSEAKAIDSLEKGGDVSTVDTQLKIDISSLKSRCAQGATVLSTVPHDLTIPAAPPSSTP